MGGLLEIWARGTIGIYSKKNTRKARSAISSKIERISIFREYLGTSQEFEELPIKALIVLLGLLTNIVSFSIPIFAYINSDKEISIFDTK